jgi:hypothetical protein
MIKLLILSATLLTLLVGTAVAADVSGDWTGHMSGPDGGAGMAITLHLKQDGSKLTGTMDGPQGDTVQISDGKVQGDKISFSVTVSMGGGDGMTIVHEGTVQGDEMKLVVKMEGGPGGEGPGGGPGPITLKRSK